MSDFKKEESVGTVITKTRYLLLLYITTSIALTLSFARLIGSRFFFTLQFKDEARYEEFATITYLLFYLMIQFVISGYLVLKKNELKSINSILLFVPLFVFAVVLYAFFTTGHLLSV